MQKWHDRDGGVGGIEGEEFRVRGPLGQRNLGDVRAQAREEGNLQVALQLEGAAGLVLDRRLDLAFVPVRVEGQGKDRGRADGENEDAGQADERVLYDFHMQINVFRSKGCLAR